MNNYFDEEYLYKALLELQYLPAVHKEPDLPPYFSISNFPKELATELSNTKKRAYGWTTIIQTRFDGLIRSMGFPHPAGHSRLVIELIENWPKIEKIMKNNHSDFLPKKYRDERLFIMNYGSAWIREDNKAALSLGSKWLVVADISSCFPSLYTHSVPWAAVGVTEAKKNKNDDTLWYNKIDMKLRCTTDNETSGVLIGPATSNIICEYILSSIDNKLNKYNFFRFIDDYSMLCKTEQEADEFIKDLQHSLKEYHLHLNPRKTKKIQIQNRESEDWKTLINLMPLDDEQISRGAIRTYFEYLSFLRAKFPDKNILKYGIKKLINNYSENLTKPARTSVELFLLDFCFSQPTLIPLLEKIFSNDGPSEIISGEFEKLLETYLKLGYYDCASWILYYCLEYHLPISEENLLEVAKTHDFILMRLVYEFNYPKPINEVNSFLISLSDFKDTDRYLDEYWPLRYDLYMSIGKDQPELFTPNEIQCFNIMGKYKFGYFSK